MAIKTHEITLQGILYDDKSSFLRGPAKAPPEIRAAYHSSSANYFAENGLEIRPELFDDAGDYTIADYFDIEAITRTNLTLHKPLITLGGDHSISYPVLKAFHALYGPLEVLHIDAHGDLYQQFDEDPYSHACPFARIMEDGLVSRLVQVGVRTLNTHQREQVARFGVELTEMKDFNLKKLPRFTNPMYVSLDIDALDPGCAPGVSHQEPGGLMTREVLALLQSLEAPVVGADIVEYNPLCDLNKMTAMVSAKLLKEIAGIMLQKT